MGLADQAFLSWADAPLLGVLDKLAATGLATVFLAARLRVWRSFFTRVLVWQCGDAQSNAVLKLLGKTGQDWSAVQQLLNSGKRRGIEYQGNCFYIRMN